MGEVQGTALGHSQSRGAGRGVSESVAPGPSRTESRGLSICLQVGRGPSLPPLSSCTGYDRIQAGSQKNQGIVHGTQASPHPTFPALLSHCSKDSGCCSPRPVCQAAWEGLGAAEKLVSQEQAGIDRQPPAHPWEPALHCRLWAEGGWELREERLGLFRKKDRPWDWTVSRCLGSTAMGSHPPVHPHLGGHDVVTVALPSGGQPCGHAPCSALRTSRGGLGRIEARQPGPPSCREVRLPWEQLAQHVAVDGGQLPGGGSLATSGGGCECSFGWRASAPSASSRQGTSHTFVLQARGGPESAPGKPQTVLPDTHKAGAEKQASRPAQPGPADLGRAARPPSQLHQPAPQPCKPPRSSHPPIPLSLSGASVPPPPSPARLLSLSCSTSPPAG